MVQSTLTKEIYHILVEAAPNAVIMVDAHGKIVLVNSRAEALFGYTRQELVGQTVELLVPERVRPQHVRYREAFFAEPKTRALGAGRDLYGVRKDGSEVPIEIGLSPFRTVQGSFVLASIIDITERKRFEHLKDEFVSVVSHELRTPLAITREAISLVLDGVSGSINEKQRDVLTTARNNIDRLARVINGLLDISKLEAGKVEVIQQRVDLKALVKQVADSFAIRAREKGLALKVDLPQEEVVICADADKLVQIFTNLVGNALKFTERGQIEIAVRDEGDRVACRVADTGRGVASEDLPKIFSKFQQFGRIAGGGERGTGLGLAIVKGLIELHHGAIQVASELGKGTAFTFTLQKGGVDD